MVSKEDADDPVQRRIRLFQHNRFCLSDDVYTKCIYQGNFRNILDLTNMSYDTWHQMMEKRIKKRIRIRMLPPTKSVKWYMSSCIVAAPPVPY